MSNKTKVIGFRTSEELFNTYSSLDIKSKKLFVNKCNELLEKFLEKVNIPNVNKLNQEVIPHEESVNISNVNKSTEESVNKLSQVSISRVKHEPSSDKEIEDLMKEIDL